MPHLVLENDVVRITTVPQANFVVRVHVRSLALGSHATGSITVVD